MNKIEKLTKQQIDAMPRYVHHYAIEIPIKQCNNDDELIKATRNLYKMCELDEPVVLIADNPLEAQLMANIIDSNQQVSNQVRDKVSNQVRDKVIQVSNQMKNQVKNQVWDQGIQVSNQVWDQVRDQVIQVSNQVKNQVWDKVRKIDMKFYNFSIYGNISDMPIIAFYDFFQQECDIDYDSNDKFDIWKSVVKSGIYDMIQFDKLAIVVRNPLEILRDENNNLIDGMSIKFKGLEYLTINNIIIDDPEILIWYDDFNGNITRIKQMMRIRKG